MKTKEEREREDFDLASGVLVVLGWILPLAGMVWGPGSWWQYLIWLAIGTVLIWLHDEYAQPGKEDKQ